MNQDLIAKAQDNTIRVSPLKLANIARSIVNQKANSAVNHAAHSAINSAISSAANSARSFCSP